MKFSSHCEIINNVAVSTGMGAKSKRQNYLSSLTFAKDEKSGKYYLIINNTKKPIADKFKLLNNVEKIFCRFVNEGKATIVLKEPNFTLNLQKANVSQLKSFLKIVHLAANNPNFNDESLVVESKEVDLNKENKQMKKPLTSISIKSRKDYLSTFRTIISQNLSIKSKLDSKSAASLNLLRLTINDAELKTVNKSMFDLKQLVYLDLSSNKLELIDEFNFEVLEELIMSNNEIKFIGKNIYLPKLKKLDLSNNQLTNIDQHFCSNFKGLLSLTIKNNKLTRVTPNFGYNFIHLKYLDASINQLDTLPYSISYLRLEMLDLQGNPFDFKKCVTKESDKKFVSLVELCARQVINKKIKFMARDIPRTLYDYTKISNRCVCGQASFEYHFNILTMFSMSQIAKSYSCFMVNGCNNHIPCQLTLCSRRCYLKNIKMQRQLNLGE